MRTERSGNKRQSTKAYLVAAQDTPPIWLALTDGPTRTFEIVALETHHVLGVGSGYIVFDTDKDVVKRETEAMGYTLKDTTVGKKGE